MASLPQRNISPKKLTSTMSAPQPFQCSMFNVRCSAYRSGLSASTLLTFQHFNDIPPSHQKHRALFLRFRKRALFSAGFQAAFHLRTPQPIEPVRADRRNRVRRRRQRNIHVRSEDIVRSLQDSVVPGQRDRVQAAVMDNRQRGPLHRDGEVASVGIATTISGGDVNGIRRAPRKHRSRRWR
jgi:hypothetical protein